MNGTGGRGKIVAELTPRRPLDHRTAFRPTEYAPRALRCDGTAACGSAQ